MKHTYNALLTRERTESNGQNIPYLSPNLASSQLCDLNYIIMIYSCVSLSPSPDYNSIRAKAVFHFLFIFTGSHSDRHSSNKCWLTG